MLPARLRTRAFSAPCLAGIDHDQLVRGPLIRTADADRSGSGQNAEHQYRPAARQLGASRTACKRARSYGRGIARPEPKPLADGLAQVQADQLARDLRSDPQLSSALGREAR